MVVIWFLIVMCLWAVGVIAVLLFKPLEPRRRPWKRYSSF